MTPTRLLYVGTRLHGENNYLVDRKEYDAREDQIYSLVAKYDEAMRQRTEQWDTNARLTAELTTLKAEYEKAKNVIGKVLGLV
jgi:peptidoglycan hydrolase CwlO-like protein